MSRRFDMPAVVALILITAFLVAYFMHPADETMKGGLIAAFSAAWGFYLGSSKGAHENREKLNALLSAGERTP